MGQKGQKGQNSKRPYFSRLPAISKNGTKFGQNWDKIKRPAHPVQATFQHHACCFIRSLYLRTLSRFCCALICFPHSGQYFVLLGLFDLNSTPHCSQVLMAIYHAQRLSGLSTRFHLHAMPMYPLSSRISALFRESLQKSRHLSTPSWPASVT